MRTKAARGSRFRVTRRFVAAAGEDAQAEFKAAEALLARLAARGFTANHPELFGGVVETSSGPLPTARAEVATPTTSGCGPDRSEIGDDGVGHTKAKTLRR